MACKTGACGLACSDVVQKLRVCAVGDDHVCAAAGHHAGGTQFGGHAAGAEGRTGPIGQRHHLRGDLLHQWDELCIRVGVRIGRVQAVDVAQQHQKVCLDLVGGNGVVLIDDGQGTQLQQAGQGVLEVHAPLGVLHVHAGEQDLRHSVVVGVEQPVVGVHQLTLTHSGTGLLGGGVLGAGRQRQLAHAHADGTGGYQNDLVALVFQVAEHFDQLFGVADVQPPGGVCQGRSAYFHNDAHVSVNPFPFPLFCCTTRSLRPSPRPAGHVLPARGRPEWCCRRGCTRRP